MGPYGGNKFQTISWQYTPGPVTEHNAYTPWKDLCQSSLKNCENSKFGFFFAIFVSFLLTCSPIMHVEVKFSNKISSGSTHQVSLTQIHEYCQDLSFPRLLIWSWQFKFCILAVLLYFERITCWLIGIYKIRITLKTVGLFPCKGRSANDSWNEHIATKILIRILHEHNLAREKTIQTSNSQGDL